MKRQLVQTDRPTGKVIHYYVDVGKGRARSRSGVVKGGKPIDAAIQSLVETPADRASA